MGGPSRIVRFLLASTSANVTQSSDNQRDENRDKEGKNQRQGEEGTGVAGTPTSESQGLCCPLLPPSQLLLPMILIYGCV